MVAMVAAATCEHGSAWPPQLHDHSPSRTYSVTVRSTAWPLARTRYVSSSGLIFSRSTAPLRATVTPSDQTAGKHALRTVAK